MQNRRRGLKWTIIIGAVVLGIVIGVASLFSDAEAARCRCPLVYSPVICDNGTFPNLCVAQCHHGQNCQPIPIIPPSQ